MRIKVYLRFGVIAVGNEAHGVCFFNTQQKARWWSLASSRDNILNSSPHELITSSRLTLPRRTFRYKAGWKCRISFKAGSLNSGAVSPLASAESRGFFDRRWSFFFHDACLLGLEVNTVGDEPRRVWSDFFSRLLLPRSVAFDRLSLLTVESPLISCTRPSGICGKVALQSLGDLCKISVIERGRRPWRISGRRVDSFTSSMKLLPVVCGFDAAEASGTICPSLCEHVFWRVPVWSSSSLERSLDMMALPVSFTQRGVYGSHSVIEPPTATLCWLWKRACRLLIK